MTSSSLEAASPTWAPQPASIVERAKKASVVDFMGAACSKRCADVGQCRFEQLPGPADGHDRSHGFGSLRFPVLVLASRPMRARLILAALLAVALPVAHPARAAERTRVSVPFERYVLP